jgi:tape measure domain-containing protein
MDVEKLSLLLEVQGSRFEQQLKRQNAQAYRIFRQLEDRASAMEKGVGASFTGLGKRIGGVFAGIAVGSALNDIRKAGDEYTKIINSLKVAGVSSGALAGTFGQLFEIAQKNATPLDTLAQLYGRVSQAQTTLKATSGEIMQVTETVAQSLRVSGVSASAASGALLQLAQAFSNGKVQAEEYNSLLDGAYPLLQAAAAGMQQAGGDVSKLTALVKDGKVSSEGFFRAIQAGAPLLEQKLAGAADTTEQAMQRLRNEFTVAVGKFDEATGASQKLTGAMGGVANSIAPIGTAATDAALKVGALIDALGNLARQGGSAISGALASAQADTANTQRTILEAKLRGAIGPERTGIEAQLKALDQGAQNQSAKWARAADERERFIDAGKAAGDFGNIPTPQSLGGDGTTDSPRLTRLGAAAKPVIKPIDNDKFKPAGDKDGKGGGGSSKDTLDSYEKALVASEKRRQALLLEAEMEGKSTFAKARAREALELETAAKRANIPVTEAMRQKIEEAATGYANAKVKVEEVQKAVEGFNDASKFFGDGITDALGDMIIDGERAADTMKSLVKQLAQAALQAALMGSGPLAGIFGTSTGTSAPGGIIGTLNGGRA